MCTLRGSQVWHPLSLSLTRKGRSTFCYITLVECKEAFHYSISTFSVITVARGCSERLLPGLLEDGSAAVADVFFETTMS